MSRQLRFDFLQDCAKYAQRGTPENAWITKEKTSAKSGSYWSCSWDKKYYFVWKWRVWIKTNIWNEILFIYFSCNMLFYIISEWSHFCGIIFSAKNCGILEYFSKSYGSTRKLSWTTFVSRVYERATFDTFKILIYKKFNIFWKNNWNFNIFSA